MSSVSWEALCFFFALHIMSLSQSAIESLKSLQMRTHLYACTRSVNCSLSHALVLHCFHATLTLPSLRRELQLSLQLKQWSSNCDKNNFRLLNILFVVRKMHLLHCNCPLGMMLNSSRLKTHVSAQTLSCTETHIRSSYRRNTRAH